MDADPRPQVGQRIALQVVASGARLLTVVDGVDGSDGVLVREPLGVALAADAPALQTGTALVASWTSVRGAHELDLVLTGLPRERVRLWQLAVQGPTRTTQRRRYARAADALPAVLHEGERRFEAVVCDLSEGGARCVAPVAGQLRTDQRVVLSMTVDDEPLDLPARVLSAEPLDGPRAALRLEFDPVRRAGDVLRRRVLAQQRRERAVAR